MPCGLMSRLPASQTARRVTKLQSKMAISNIERIRVRNNKLWMNLLRLAVEARPEKAKEIIGKIGKNDREITQWLRRI